MTSTKISQIIGRRVWDSRGRPTVEAEVILSGGTIGRAIAPSGASRGSHEAVDLRDGGDELAGFGVETALDNLSQLIAPRLTDMDAIDQEAVDLAMIDLDDTDTKSSLGGNTMIAVSMAVLHAAAAAAGQPLWRYIAGDNDVRIPMPEIQIFGGGAHAGGRVDIQDFMAVPIGAESFDDGIEMIAEVYIAAGQLMANSGKLAGLADEGGWWPEFNTNEEALDMLVRAIEAANLTPGEDVALSLDIAASGFGKGGLYTLGLEKRELDSDGLIEMLAGWIDRYPIVSIEDPLGEDDAAAFRAFTDSFGDTLQIIGDDFLVTSAERIDAAAEAGICNSTLIKPNQAGTITETKAALDAAKNAGWATVVSARSGETEDVTIAHLAVGWNAGQLKVGSFARSERMAKWNEVLRIEEELGDTARLAGT
ncbi:MAG: Enolase [Alphaproteobacteria bacterium MarineAlpha11_Bin1]|nr:MAG: Enolase [Alphaproteobacteria bacterium MarineAlpha11_Bin1]|tara:strand:- start:1132 stop:2397 length:1266 start_codon:yes stop_codon:yes gene_type:complete